MIGERSERHPVDRLAEEFVARYRSGERPSISEYAGRYPDLAGELQELLTALVLMEEHGPAGSAPAGRCDDDDPVGEGDLATNRGIPDQLGEYRILREIGRGGMGFVYEAVQETLGRHVALKVLPVPTLMDPTRLKRFQREVQAAARLHHTNIVSVFGVGEWNAGDLSSPVHYYAMQFIQGRGLDKVIDELRHLGAKSDTQTPRHGDTEKQSLPASASAELSTQSDTPRYYRSVARVGEQVAEALAHAHRQGILHRDVKPGNLLLDGQGTVWVTDFGLAKAVASPGGDAGDDDLTQTGDVVGTLRYMAPERLQGQGDARADVYSLGLTLYELLTLRPAFDAPDRATLVRQITQDNPPRPRKLDPRIPRDLETIVLKACAKEPARRYATASELAEDLRRFLGDRPIEARRTPWWEHAWRWCRRNPGIAAASAIAVSALLIGLGVSLWQWRRADHNFQQAEASAAQAEKDFQLAFQAIEQMLERVGGDRLDFVPHMDQTRRALLQDAVRFYQDLLRGKEDHPKVRLAMARAHCRLGQLHYWLNDLDQAVRHQDLALTLLENLLGSDPHDVEHRSLAATIYFFRGAAKRDAVADAEVNYRQALAGWESLSAERPEHARFVFGRTYTLLQLGGLMRRTTRLLEAESFLRQSIALAERLPAKQRYRSWLLASGLRDLALVLEANGSLTESERSRRRALEFFERSLQESPNASSRHDLAMARRNLAELQARGAQGRGPEAEGETERLFMGAIELCERLSADFPDIPGYRVDVAKLSNEFGVLLGGRGRAREAEAALDRSVALFEELVANFPETAVYHHFLGAALNNLAMQRQARGDLAGARLLLEQAIQHQEVMVKVNHEHANALTFLANHQAALADVLVKLKQPREAEQTALRQRALAQELAGKDGKSALVRVFQARVCESLAYVRRDTDQRAEAMAAFGEAAGHWRRLVADFPNNPHYQSRLGADLSDWANVLRKERRWADMIPLLDEAIRLQEAAVRAKPKERSYQQFLYNHYFLGVEARIGLGDHADVSPAAAAIRDRFPDLFDDYWWAVRLARCIPLAEKDPHLPREERARLAGEYAEQAMSFLRAAQRKKSRDLPTIHTHPAFQPLRGRPDFQNLLAEVPKAEK